MSIIIMEKCCSCPSDVACLCVCKPVKYFSQGEVDDLFRVEHGQKLLAQTNLVVLNHRFRQLQSELKDSIEDEDENVHIIIDKIFNKYSQSSDSATLKSSTQSLLNSLGTCSDISVSDKNSSSEHFSSDELLVENWVERRIRDEYRKHPNLDWIKIASLKILRGLK